MSNESNRKPNDPQPYRHRLISWPLMLIGLTVAALLVANTVSAWGRSGQHDIEDIKAHVDHFLDRALDRLDASDEQDASIRQIVMTAIDDLDTARGELGSGGEALRDLLAADSIDRNALEALRASRLDRADEMSRIVVEGLADVMEILTPEQRRALEARLEKHHERHRGHGGWGWH